MEKIPTNSALDSVGEINDKVELFQKQYNVNSKNFIYIIGKNLSLFVCMLVPLLMIGFIWVDFKELLIDTRMISDGIATVLLFAAGEIMMTQVGTGGGKLDDSYIEAKGTFEALLAEVAEVGTLLIGVFCNWQIDMELEQARRFRLSALKMTPKMYEEVEKLSYSELVEKIGKDKAKKIEEIKQLKPIELNEAILLFDGEYTARGGVSESAEAYLKNRWHLLASAIRWIFAGLLVINIAFTMTDDVTVARVIYTVFKLTVLLTNMARGYARGATAYNTVQVRNYKAKSNYLRQYLKFVKEKTYLKLGDKYGDVAELVGEEEIAA